VKDLTSAAKAREIELLIVRDEKTQLQSQVTRLKLSNEAVKEELTQSIAIKCEVDEQLSVKSQEVVTLKEMMLTHNGAVQTLSAERDALRSEVSDLEGQMSELKAQLASQEVNYFLVFFYEFWIILVCLFIGQPFSGSVRFDIPSSDLAVHRVFILCCASNAVGRERRDDFFFTERAVFTFFSLVGHNHYHI
jgi:hypothetical protein